MKKSFTLLVLLMGITGFAYAQTVFQHAFTLPSANCVPRSVQQCSDHGYLTTASDGYQSSVIIRTDSVGELKWSKLFSSSSSETQYIIQSVECSDGYLLLGFYGGAVTSGLFVQKLDLAGNSAWTQLYAGTENTYMYSKIRVTADGGYIVSESSFHKMGAFKCGSDGNVQWSYSYTGDPSKNPSFDCRILSDGSMIFTGKRNCDIILLKTDPNGNIVWTKVMNDGNSYYHANAVTSVSTGGLITVGYDDFQPFVMKTDDSGNLVWYKQFLSSVSNSGFEQVVELANGNFLVSGVGDSSLQELAIVDPNGALLEVKAFSFDASSEYSAWGNANTPALCATADGGYLCLTTCRDQQGLNYMVLSKSDAASSPSCGFTNSSLNENAGVSSPAALSASLSRTTEAYAGSALTISSSDYTPLEKDFCTLKPPVKPIEGAPTLLAFPTPLVAGGELQIWRNGLMVDGTLEIYDANGKMLQKMNVTAQQYLVNISTAGFAPGIYFAHLHDADGGLLGNARFVIGAD